MEITIINELKQFEELKTAWDAVYSSDDRAQIFLSWAWLRGWFEVTPNPWFVLGVRLDNSSPYVGFFPLSIGRVQKYGLNLLRELRMGGDSSADYTGFICLPEYEKKVISAFAGYVQQQLEWDVFLMKNVLDPRLDVFLKCFSQEKFKVQEVNNTCCPYIPLPNTWEQYLRDFLDSKERINLRRRLKKIESSNEFRFIQAQEDNLESQIEALLTLWQLRWGTKSERDLNIKRSIFRRCFENNCLWLNVLWKETTPIAGIAIFIEQQNKTFYFYITGYDAKFSNLAPGRVTIAYSIRDAIENGFQIYDFLRGDEDYKFSRFGAKKRFNTSVTIARTSLRGTLINLIRRSRSEFPRSRGSLALDPELSD